MSIYDEMSNLEYYRGVLDNHGISDPIKYIKGFGVSDQEIDNVLDSNDFEPEVLAGIMVIKTLDGEDPRALFKDADISSFTGKNWQHNLVGNYIIDRYHACIIDGAVHVYMDGIYVPGEDIIHQLVLKLDDTATTNKRKEVYQYIKQSPRTPRKEISPVNLIPFKSKIYDLKTDREIEYSHKYVFFNRLPYDYIPNVIPQPLIDKILNDITQGDKEVTALILECIGYCFYRRNQFRCAVILFGESGSNGKSTLLNMIKQAIGKENCSSLSLQDTAEKFRVGELRGKLANIGDDIPAKMIEDSSLFKKTITGETIYCERKGQDPIPFENSAKMFYACNELPQSLDKSEALYSRLKIIPLNADFSSASGKCDTNFKNREWTQAEMEYLICLAMDGLKRLLANDKFTEPYCMKQAIYDYKLENDTVLSFINETASEKGATYFVDKPIRQVYVEYTDYAKRGNYKPLSDKKFGKRFRQATKLEVFTKSIRDVSGYSKTVKVYDYPIAS